MKIKHLFFVALLFSVNNNNIYADNESSLNDCDENISSYSNSNYFLSTTCTPESPVYCQDFSQMSASPPYCWEEGNLGSPTSGPANNSDSGWKQDGFGNIGTSGAARIKIFRANLNNEWLISPEFDLSYGSWMLEFNIALTASVDTSPSNLGSDDKVTLVITDDGINWSILETWDNSSSISNLGQNHFYDLSNFDGSIVKFGFIADDGVIDDSEDVNFYLDDFCVKRFCPVPASLQTTNIYGDGAELSWNELGTATSWDIEVVEDGNSPTGIPTIENITSTNYTWTGGIFETNYLFLVRSHCGNKVSSWSLPTSFTTTCLVTSTYREGFDEPFSCWSEGNGIVLSTGPTNYNDSEWQLYKHPNFNHNFPWYKIDVGSNDGMDDWLISPEVYVSDASYFVEISMRISGTLDADDIVSFVVTIDGGSTWSVIDSWDNTSGPIGSGFILYPDRYDFFSYSVANYINSTLSLR